jgi:hypothetical protein
MSEFVRQHIGSNEPHFSGGNQGELTEDEVKIIHGKDFVYFKWDELTW